ncbi:hypothetical protein B0H10DRAFT_1953091 [Mycena sp. CBHHK59/15]|nr:hypothetical protein B0H10DRAFT_1953091 [Mycena sp. CBHHK59/15]
MSAKPSLLIIGPGLVGSFLLTTFLKKDCYALTIMVWSAEQIDILSKLGIKTIQAGLEDLETITQAITINAASAEDVNVAEAFISGLRRSPQNAAGDQKIYLQSTWRGTGQVENSRVRPFKKIFIQILAKKRAALRDRYASYGNDGQATFAHISISNLVAATGILLDALQNDRVDITTNLYFNPSNCVETRWLDVAVHIGSNLYARCKISEPALRSSGPAFNFYWGSTVTPFDQGGPKTRWLCKTQERFAASPNKAG